MEKRKPIAIVYTSNTGYTEAYARLLSAKTGLGAYRLEDSASLSKGAPVIYMGWIMANHIKGYRKAAKRFDILAVCAVGLCDTGALISEVRRAEKLPEKLPLFTLQGGMDHSKLRGIYKFMIDMLIKMLSKNEPATEDDARKLQLIKNGGDFVSEVNLAMPMEWIRNIL